MLLALVCCATPTWDALQSANAAVAKAASQMIVSLLVFCTFISFIGVRARAGNLEPRWLGSPFGDTRPRCVSVKIPADGAWLFDGVGVFSLPQCWEFSAEER